VRASRPPWFSVGQPTLGQRSMVEMARLKDMTIHDGTTGERLTSSLLWLVKPASTTRGCQAHSQGLSRLDPATRTHRPSVLSCTRGKPEGAMASSGSLNAGIAPSQSTGPGFGQPAQRSQRASASVSKGCDSLRHRWYSRHSGSRSP
jgi:hypothetical protein